MRPVAAGGVRRPLQLACRTAPRPAESSQPSCAAVAAASRCRGFRARQALRGRPFSSSTRRGCARDARLPSAPPMMKVRLTRPKYPAAVGVNHSRMSGWSAFASASACTSRGASSRVRFSRTASTVKAADTARRSSSSSCVCRMHQSHSASASPGRRSAHLPRSASKANWPLHSSFSARSGVSARCRR